MNKTKEILGMLDRGILTVEEISVAVGCKTAYVYQISSNRKRDVRIAEAIQAANNMLDMPTLETCDNAYDALSSVFDVLTEDQRAEAKALIADLLGGN